VRKARIFAENDPLRRSGGAGYKGGMTPKALFEQAVGAHRGGDLARAEQLYRQLLQIAPASYAGLHMLGVLRAQQGDPEEALALIGHALAQQPGAADALFNQGRVLKGMGRLDEALASYDRALAARPDYDTARIARAEARNLHGITLQQAGRYAEAVAAYDGALADAPGYGDAINNRAVTLFAMGRLEEALAGFDHALRVKPDYVEGHFNRGNVLRDMLRLDEAVQSFDRAIALDPGFAPAWRNKAFVALMRGDFAQGFALCEWRKKLTPPIEARNYARPLWTGVQDIAGKTLFLYIEQGLGDTIQFYRFVTPLLTRGARVILAVQDGMQALMATATPQVELIGSRAVPDNFDYHIPLMSLPLALGLTPDDIAAAVPYLRAEPQRVAHWRERMGDKGFKIGISWQGARGGVTSRAMPLSSFAGLAALPGVRLISLQKGFGTEQLADVPGVESLGEDFDNGPGAFLDSAAVMESLDFVITLDSALAHLAGALNRPVWVALKQVPDWRWFLGRDDSPWYPGMRLFRQTREGDWHGVFAAMEKTLAGMLR
jgi:tetratricopeptide (TPR) repeat protein